MGNEIVRVDFYGGEIEAVQEDGKIWVSVRRCCESLGIDVEGQRKKLKEKDWAVTEFMSATGPDGKSYQTFMIDLDSFPMWLGTIEASRVKEEARQMLVRYQKKAAKVLRDYFFGGSLVKACDFTRRQLAEMVIAAEDEADKAKAEVKQLTPYAEAGKAMSVESGYYKIYDFAKMVIVDGKAIGGKNLYSWLRDKEILLSSDANWNDPAQVHVNNGRFRLKKGTFEKGDDGERKGYKTTLITPKGMGYVANRLKGDPDFESVAIDVDGLSDMGIELV